jgi:hypothetical protein
MAVDDGLIGVMSQATQHAIFAQGARYSPWSIPTNSPTAYPNSALLPTSRSSH